MTRMRTDLHRVSGEALGEFEDRTGIGTGGQGGVLGQIAGLETGSGSLPVPWHAASVPCIQPDGQRAPRDINLDDVARLQQSDAARRPPPRD